MSGDLLWSPLLASLDRIARDGITLSFWLRDDDAEAPNPALETLLDLSQRYGVPFALAVIPKFAVPALARRLADASLVTPCQHGFAHVNHAVPPERATELGGHRKGDEVLDELRLGRRLLLDLFAERLDPMLVPPWNRYDAALEPGMAAAGFSCLSVFGRPAAAGALAKINTHVDLIDWRGGRVTRPPEKLIGALVDEMSKAAKTNRQVGVLTHHLVHDARAWAFLEGLFRHTAAHPAVRWRDIATLQRIDQTERAGRPRAGRPRAGRP
jgi:peptidoglycan/xylan/chitin deacetylase (PgdA/CDA1 family)